MNTKASQDEEIYLDFVKINITLEREDLERLLKDSAVGGAGPKSGRNIAESLMRKKDDLPHPEGPISAVTLRSLKSRLISNNACFSP
jgi:hypothetical protein